MFRCIISPKKFFPIPHSKECGKVGKSTFFWLFFLQLGKVGKDFLDFKLNSQLSQLFPIDNWEKLFPIGNWENYIGIYIGEYIKTESFI